MFSHFRGRNKEAIIAVNPGGEETWDRLVSAHGQPNCPFVVMNNAYSTSYDLGNRKGFEEVNYLKRISRGFVFRSFPGNWDFVRETRWERGGAKIIQNEAESAGSVGVGTRRIV